MATKSELVDDIMLRIYSGKPSDDSELSKRQIAHWLAIERDGLLQFVFNEALKKGDLIDPFYAENYWCQDITKENKDCFDPDCTEYRYYFTLPKDVLVLKNDSGIIWVRDSNNSLLAHGDINKNDYLRNLPYGGISSSRQAFYRENRDIFIEEASESLSTTLSYSVRYIPMAAGATIGDDDQYPIEDGLVPQLLDNVEAIARRQISGLADLDNDGTDPYHE